MTNFQLPPNTVEIFPQTKELRHAIEKRKTIPFVIPVFNLASIGFQDNIIPKLLESIANNENLHRTHTLYLDDNLFSYEGTMLLQNALERATAIKHYTL